MSGIRISLPVWGRWRRLLAWVLRDKRIHVRPGVTYTFSAWVNDGEEWRRVESQITPTKGAKTMDIDLSLPEEESTVVWGAQLEEAP